MLFCLDMDGTLVQDWVQDHSSTDWHEKIRAAAGNYGNVVLLPDVSDRIRDLAMMPGSRFAIVTNQGGVGCGYQTPDTCYEKLGKLTAALHGFYGRPLSWHAAFEHKDAVDPDLRVDNGYRKPGPGMIMEAMRNHRADPLTTVMVGDRDPDRRAAEAAGVRYYDRDEFFRLSGRVPA